MFRMAVNIHACIYIYREAYIHISIGLCRIHHETAIRISKLKVSIATYIYIHVL